MLFTIKVIHVDWSYPQELLHTTHMQQNVVQLVGQKRAIVYLNFVRDVAPVAIALREKGVRSCSYHGKNMSSHDKVKAMDHWRPNDSSIQVMVCTSAFGVGIDVANIDLVIKIGCPSSVEELVQMFGRAGRDGRRAEGIHIAACVLMYMYFRCIASDVHDSVYFTYKPVQAFSCIQSQTFNMLPSGVRD